MIEEHQVIKNKRINTGNLFCFQFIGEFDNDLVKINGSMLVKKFMELTPGSAPASPTKGTIYYVASDDKMKIWSGASWSNLN